jgi:hypothetical protein
MIDVDLVISHPMQVAGQRIVATSYEYRDLVVSEMSWKQIKSHLTGPEKAKTP